VNVPQRPPREPVTVQRLGHVVLRTTTYLKTLNWYLKHLGMIVSDFQYYPGQRQRGPVMSFIRCDRGRTPADHHTLALALGPANRYEHSAYQVADLDSLAAGGQYLLDRGYQRSWGIGRHVQGSQIFDYWRDPNGFLVEHFTDGDLFDCTLEPGWALLSASGLAQWGPPATKDFVAQATNYASHVTDTGGNPETVPLAFFRKSSGSISGPVLLDADGLKRFTDLRVTLSVNGEPRQNMTAADMIYLPVETLQALTRFQRLDPGDLLLTGTPVGTAIGAPPKPVQVLASLLPAAVKWKLFLDGQARNPNYLHDGDVIEATVATDDGAIDLGTQRTVVRYTR
jgi:2-keto-4-pentenoate hydratase/2-oxohepta-3-ene-1,7-dioic acid hydratase in catechol pathway/catechol 2,3-dioxygenase-like lactoylglutathione lyase family enzyme